MKIQSQFTNSKQELREVVLLIKIKRVILQVKDGKHKFFMELIRSLDFVQVAKNQEDTKEEILANLNRASKK